jgi:glycosyltransferase involved in cell wall biosynthesis
MNSAATSLLISPVMPDRQGSGLAQRAYRILREMAEKSPTYLVVVRTEDEEAQVPADVAACSCGISHLLAGRSNTTLRRLAVLFPWLVRWNESLAAGWLVPARNYMWKGLPAHIERLVVFRLRCHGIAESLPSESLGKAARHLDLDDLESATLRSISKLAWRQRRWKFALSARSHAIQYRQIERRVLEKYDQVSLANSRDIAALGQILPKEKLRHLPNAVSVADGGLHPMPDASTAVFLFVGTLEYFPNADAAMWIARSICDELRRNLGRPFRLLIAGRRAPQWLVDAVCGVPEVEFLGEVEDLAPLYGQSHALLAAVRGGGGTKVKVLEAMAHGCPVIATPHAVDGLPGKAGEHFLLAEIDSEFVTACRTLVEQPALWHALAREAFQLVRSPSGRS